MPPAWYPGQPRPGFLYGLWGALNAGCNCTFLKPDHAAICQVLEEKRIPLLQYVETAEGPEFRVVSYKSGRKFVVVSHVWDHGLGNPSGNAMLACQIANLNRFIQKFADFEGRVVYFWIDSLMVPIAPRELRKRAVAQMFDTYSAAQWTIVLDRDLMANKAGSGYLEPAMRITRCDWMKRLWTFQEAVMSKTIYFLFQDGLKDIEDLEQLYPDATANHSVAEAARSFYVNLIRPRDPNRHPNAELVGSIWKAVQWRSTSHRSDETLAIARILNISTDALLACSPEDRMKVMLANMHEIPPGLIFSPASRLEDKGFRWAPKSWMVGSESEYPDVFSLPIRRAKFPSGYSIVFSSSLLTPDGLMVRYPGYRLCSYGKSVRVPFISDNLSIFFPSKSNLREWYAVTGVKYDEELQNLETRLYSITGASLCGDESDIGPNASMDTLESLAVICCRPRPGTIPEIALLVSITRQRDQALLVRRICRIFIQLVVQEQVLAKYQQAFKERPEAHFWGEELASDQAWIVD